MSQKTVGDQIIKINLFNNSVNFLVQNDVLDC